MVGPFDILQRKVLEVKFPLVLYLKLIYSWEQFRLKYYHIILSAPGLQPFIFMM